MISSVITLKDDTVLVHKENVDSVGTTFKPGVYSCHTDSQGNIHIKRESFEEIHTPYLNDINKHIVETVELFFKDSIKETVNKLGFTHKLGILLHGKQGTAKTAFINFVSSKMIEEKDSIAFFCDSGNQFTTAIGLAKSIRAIQENPIIFICDEFERFAQEEESLVKNFLDGNMSINNSLFLATTNYIHKVPEAIKDRPSRIKIVEEFKGITDKKEMFEVISAISKKIDPNLFTESEINEEVNKIDSATLDELKHICLSKVTNSYIKTPKRESIGFKFKNPLEELMNKDEEDSPGSGFLKLLFNNSREVGGNKVNILENIEEKFNE